MHDNLVVDNGRADIRFERVGDKATAGEALIEDNEVHGNSPEAVRGGISVRDTQNATIRHKRFGEVIIGRIKYPADAHNLAIIASDSGRSSRPNLGNILIENNILMGEIIKGCDLKDKVTCRLNTP